MVHDEVGGGLARAIEEIADREPQGGYEEACQGLLHLLRRHVGMEIAWTSEFVGTEQIFRLVDSEPGTVAPPVGSGTPLNDAYCSRVLAGTMPAIIPDVRLEPLAVWLDVTFAMHIGSYLGVPLHGLDGTPNGMLCIISSGPVPDLDEHDLSTARLVAGVLDDLHHRALGESAARRERRALQDQVRTACAGLGRWSVLQPIVDLSSGVAVAAEGLTRFDDARRTPSGWFAAAHSVGLGHELELAAARGALERLDDVGGPPALTVNLSPEVVLEGLPPLLAGADLSRVILELTEYAPVTDYERMAAVLEPYRRDGLRIAVDDAGAGYASMSHVLRLRPDVLKVDMSLVRDVDTDPIRQALIGALVRFCAVAGAVVVAEGVETTAELDAVGDLGVELAQGYLFGQPSAHPTWDGHPTFARVA